MSILCLWNPAWRTAGGAPAEILPLLLEEAPRVVVEARGIIWVDVRGLPSAAIANRLLERLAEYGEGTRGGVAAMPIAAAGAALYGIERPTIVRPGDEAGFLSNLTLSLVAEDERLLTLLDGAGISTCGQLAALTAEAVEVRFGNEGVRAWRLARADDPRVVFRPIPPEQPVASVDFVDYTVRDATRLVFTLNALLEQVCDALRGRARRARTLTLVFSLADGNTVREVLRTARPTADRTLWMRRLRVALEQIQLAHPIAGVAIEAPSTEPVSGLQGDLFDRGFSTAAFVEEAVTRLLDMYRGIFVRQLSVPDPLAERRARWTELMPEEIVESHSHAATGTPAMEMPPRHGAATSEGGPTPSSTGDASPATGHPALALQLLSEPRPIRIRTRSRRDHVLPVRYLDEGQWRDLTAAGPDRISGGHEEARPYAREYFRCVSDAGALLWLYRDAIDDRWFLHGWWR